jgi:Arc/MetJ family transcription regulator
MHGTSRAHPPARHPALRRAARAALATVPLVLAACATTGATYRSGVGDALLEHPPFYAGTAPGDGARVAHLPVRYHRGAMQAALFDPAGGRGTAVAALLDEMNGYLDSLAATVPLRAAPAGTPPDVAFGCEPDPAGPADECRPRDASARSGAAASTCASRWAAPRRTGWPRPRPALDRAGAARALVLTLETAEYLPRQTGVRGDKRVELGSGHTAELPWLTSLETPVTVLQLTGALVGRDGRAVRIGAEGLVARRTPLVASSVGAQSLLTDDDVAALRTARRTDLPGAPLVWQVALRTLVGELAGRQGVAGPLRGATRGGRRVKAASSVERRGRDEGRATSSFPPRAVPCGRRTCLAVS